MSNITINKKRSKVDWIAAKSDYVTNLDETYESVSSKYGVSRQAVHQHAEKDGWIQARKDLAKRSVEPIEGDIVDKRREANDRHGVAARNMQAIASLELRIAFDQTQKYLQTNPSNAHLGKGTGAVSPFNMKLILDSLKLGIDLERVTLGLPNTVVNNQVTGANGEKLFEETNIDALTELVSKTIEAITRGTTKASNEQSSSTS